MSQRRITEIEIKDYRAFFGRHRINLEEGENLLVYGENGSGKTSLYRAMLDFFQSTASPQPIAEAVNIWQSPGTDPEISVTFTEFDAPGKKIPGSDADFKANDTAFADFVEKANLSKGFFSYRELLKTHLIDVEEHDSFFKLFQETILADHVSSSTGTTLAEEFALIVHAAFKFGDSSNPDDDPTSQFDDYNRRLENSLLEIEQEVNKFMPYFKQGLNIELPVPTKAEFSVITGSAIITPPQVDIKVKLFDAEIPEHYNFLNEARLSALALSIYLAALKINPTQGESRILFLDDTFIGLDMGNRLPLLAILNDHFSDYQIFITTYDRAWFELAGTHLKGNWKSVEMYTKEEVRIEHPDGNRYPKGEVAHPPGSRPIQFENPLIIDPSMGHLEKARQYFDLKDYPACANYQRKWCEQFLKAYLQDNYRLEIAASESVQAITKLETLFNKLKQFYKDCGLSLGPDIEDAFPRHRDTVMNPFSHDDLESPVYRQELERGFKLIEAFQALQPLRKATVAYRDDIIEYSEPALNYSCRLKITSEPLSLIRHGNSISIFQGKGDVVDFTENGVIRPAPQASMQDLTIDQFYEKIAHHLAKKHTTFTPNPDRFSALVIHPQKISLRQIIDG